MNRTLRIFGIAVLLNAALLGPAEANDWYWSYQSTDGGNSLFEPKTSLFQSGIGSILAMTACVGAALMGSYLCRHSDYMSPSNYFTIVKPRHWKLPHEQYMEEQRAKKTHDEANMPAFELEEED